jgi:hypothetical protein
MRRDAVSSASLILHSTSTAHPPWQRRQMNIKQNVIFTILSWSQQAPDWTDRLRECGTARDLSAPDLAPRISSGL